jgi:hypothetical protein
MITNVKPLNISESKAQKALDDAMNEAIKVKAVVKLLPTDWTLERLLEKGLSDAQARSLINKMISDGLAVEIRYLRNNRYMAKGCRAK